MSDEFCAGVQIILKRMESNPDEFINPHEYKWQKVVAGVFARKEGISTEGVGAVRGLTDAEIDALYEGFVKLARPAFDEYVMKEVLDTESERDSISEQMWQMTQGRQKARMQGSGWTDPRIQVTAGGSGGSGGVTVDNAALRKMVDEQIQQKKQHRKESALSRIKKGLGL